MIAVPPAGEFYADDLLDEMSYPSQRTAIDSFYQEISSPVRKIDVYHVLFTATNDYIYYRTDAKWSSYGAYCVYRNAIQRMGFAPISYDQYTVTHVASFRGNLYDACLYSKVTPDILDVYQNENGSQITEMTFFTALAEVRLGREEDARRTFRSMVEEGEKRQASSHRWGYFGVGMAAPLPSELDIKRMNLIDAHLLMLLGKAGLGQDYQSDLDALKVYDPYNSKLDFFQKLGLVK